MGLFAVIDTETNWENQLMSIGTVLADEDSFQVQATLYHILDPEYLVGGMFSPALIPDRKLRPRLCSRSDAMAELLDCFARCGVHSIYAYNAPFDRNQLPELSGLVWHDILRFAAYRQYNPKIPAWADCYSTGRLKRNYGVEAITRLLTGDPSYAETHNALYDALDELQIMRLLGHRPETYPVLGACAVS